MLKHYLTNHLGESPEEMIFRMKIVAYKRSAYERQIHESVGEDNFKISNSNIQFIIIVIDNEFNSFVQKECNKMWHNNIDSICVHVLLQNDCDTH